MSFLPVKKNLAVVLSLTAVLLARAFGQTAPANPPHTHEEAPPQHDMSSMPGMQMDEPMASSLPSPHESSGTSWQPASVAGHQWMWTRDGWDLMAHGVIFIDYSEPGGPRGAGKAESINWGMLMEQHRLGSGTILFRQMFSAESLTSPHPGFPEIFQTGETYHGAPLVDHQHPHNVFAELAALYTLPLTKSLSWELYGGPSAEPALGPVTYIHRASAAELPMAPLSHHLQDSTHTSFGVVTTGFTIDRVKLEASAFNGREPNEQRWSIQLAALDSWSGRASIAPTRNWTAQYSIGRLEHPEALEPGSQWRQTASVEYNRLLRDGGWATSIIWGRVHKIATGTTLNSYLAESTVNFRQRDYAFSRLELVDKDELFPQATVHPAYRIGAYTFGGERDVLQNRIWQLGLGADFTFYSKPAALDTAYGSNPVSFQIFLRLRPAKSSEKHSH
ncbi:MAG TPA: hypothetical protein VE377_10795 [Candidatus Dormibacteraeota bacterium]|nr:hypothetical protein [Candidatus Dormibacteraeota bacterium]